MSARVTARDQSQALAESPKSRRSKRSSRRSPKPDEVGDRVVYGVAARSKGFFSEGIAGVKDATWGGRSSSTENKYNKAIDAAVGKLLKNARGRPIGPITIRTDAEHTKGDMVVVIAYANLLS